MICDIAIVTGKTYGTVYIVSIFSVLRLESFCCWSYETAVSNEMTDLTRCGPMSQLSYIHVFINSISADFFATLMVAETAED